MTDYVGLIVTDNGSAFARVNAAFGEGTGPIFLSHLTCGGSEEGLLSCTSQAFLGIADCSHADDAGVVCPGIEILLTNVDSLMFYFRP